MTWQSSDPRVHPYIRMSMLVVMMLVFGRTDWPMESNAYLSLTRQNENPVKRPDAPASLRGLDWDLTGIAAIDQDNVWVVGNIADRRTGGTTRSRNEPLAALQANRGIVLCSTDGGQSWAIRYLEPGKYFVGVHFVDRMTGWVSDASNLILKTTDTGNTWGRQTAPAKSFWGDVKFVDPLRGWILGSDGVVLRTNDAGQEWKATKIHTTGQLYFIDFADPNNGWVVGEKGAAYETRDSGIHWRFRGDDLSALLVNRADSEIFFRAVKFVNSKIGFIAADVLSKSGSFNAKAVVFKTVDQGQTWTASIVPATLGIRSAAFLSETEAWLVPRGSGESNILHTRNGGANWSAIRLPHNGEPERLFFVDSEHGWFLNRSHNFSSDQIFSTNDGGQTWVEIKISERIGPT